MTFNEIYKDKDTIFTKVNEIIEKNKESNDEFKNFISMISTDIFKKELKKAHFMYARMIIVQILLTFIIPFSLMMYISNFVNMPTFVKFVPTIILNIASFFVIRYIFNVSKQEGLNNTFTDEYKNKDKENDLKGMISMEKETIDKQKSYVEMSADYIPWWYNFIWKLYSGYDFVGIYNISHTAFYIHLFNTILLKFNEMLVNVYNMVGEKFKSFPEENEFIEFLNKKFDDSFIKSVFDNTKYNSKIDNLIVLYYFAERIFWTEKTENNDVVIKCWIFTDYEQAKSDPKKLIQDFAVQFISYKILKYGLEKEERENLLK